MTQAEKIKERMNSQQKESKSEESAPPPTFEGWVSRMLPALSDALPSGMTGEQFARQIITLYKGTPDLRNCTVQSILGAAMQCAQIGLALGPLGHAYLVPFDNFKGYDGNNKPIKVKEAQLIIGYKGYFELGYRSGRISNIRRGIVYKDDEFTYEYGSNENLYHKPMGMEADDEVPTHYYVMVTYNTGRIDFLVKTYNQLLRFAKKHTNLYTVNRKNGNVELNQKSNYYKNRDPMFLKTVARELFQTIQLTPEVANAMAADGTIKNVEDGATVSRDMAAEVIDVTDYTYEDEAEVEQPVATTVRNGFDDGDGDPGPRDF